MNIHIFRLRISEIQKYSILIEFITLKKYIVNKAKLA